MVVQAFNKSTFYKWHFFAIKLLFPVCLVTAQEQYADVIIDSYYSGIISDYDDFYGNESLDEGCQYIKVSPTVCLGNNQNSYVSLPTDSYIIVGFTDNFIINAPNQPDIFIDEIGAMEELADIFISSDFGNNFTYFGENNGGLINELDLNDIGYQGIVNAIKIVGKDTKGCAPGFDVVRVFGLEGANCSNSAIVQSNSTLCWSANDFQLNSLITTNTDGYWTGDNLINNSEFTPNSIGVYNFKYISINEVPICPNYTFDLSIDVVASLSVDLGEDRALGFQETLDLDATTTNSTYQWSDGSDSPTFLVSGPGEYWVMVTNEVGCIGSDTVRVSYDQLINVALGNDTTICQGEAIELDLFQEGLTYKWSTGATSPSIVVSEPEIIWVNITNAYGNRTFQDTIQVFHKIFGTIEVSDTLICEVSNIQLAASGASEDEFYNWYSSDLTFLEQNEGQFLTNEVTSTQQFFMSLTDNTCESELESIKVIYEPPTASILNTDTILFEGESIQLKGAGGTSFEWAPPTYLDDPSIQNPTSKPDDNITYTLRVADDNECKDETSINLFVHPKIIFDNTFTPNGDGSNDTWSIQKLDRYPSHDIKIFDRFGNLLIGFKDYQSDWAGIVNGSDLPTGTYFYLIDLGNGQIIRGAVTIIR